MAAFLLLNGLSVPCEVAGGANRGVEQLGESVRAVDGTMRIHRRVLKNKWSFRTSILDPLQADCFRRLILGEGHSWNFDDATKGLYSGKGLAPTNSDDSSLSTTHWRGDRSLLMAGSAGQFIVSALPAGIVNWTVMAGRKVAAGAWVHNIVTNASKTAGKAWLDGVYTTDASAWLTVTTSTGEVRIDADPSDDTYLDELVILPFRIPSDAESAAAPWAAQLFDWVGTNAHAWAPLARLQVAGSAIYPDTGEDSSTSAAVTVAGKVEQTSYHFGRFDSAWGQRELRSLAFSLEEV